MLDTLSKGKVSFYTFIAFNNSSCNNVLPTLFMRIKIQFNFRKIRRCSSTWLTSESNHFKATCKGVNCCKGNSLLAVSTLPFCLMKELPHLNSLDVLLFFQNLTLDMGGSSGTSEFIKAVIANLKDAN